MLALYLAYLDSAEDEQRFGEIFYMFRKQMVTLAATIVKNESDAEDVVHNVFLKIAQKNWETVKAIENEIDLRNYLLKATKNTALNTLKLKSRDNVSLNDDTDEFKINNRMLDDNKFLNTICDKIEYEKVVKAIMSLSEKYRYVLYYHFVLELSVAETAKSLNQTVVATHKQLVRGKKMLLNRLGLKGDE